MSKWLVKKIHALPTVNVLGEAYIKRDDVLEIVGRTCAGCLFFERGEKASWSKCHNAKQWTREGWRTWRFASPSQNACQKYVQKEKTE